MKILALDTAAQSCSVAVVNKKTLMAEITSLSKQTHSKHLMEMIDTALKMSKITPQEIEGFAVTKGPGSFTGLRIGISTIKGLALASGKPLVGVSNLQVLASKFYFSTSLICAMIDARKSEVYCGFFKFENGILKQKAKEAVLSPEDALVQINEPCIFVGNGAILYKEIIANSLGNLACFASQDCSIIKAQSVANLALSRFQSNDTDNLAAFIPSYIRKSDAEICFG